MGFGKLTGSQGQTSCDSVFVDSVAFRGLTLTPFLLVAPDFCTALRPLTRNPPHSSIGPSDHPPEGRGALSWSPPLGEREGMTHHTRRPRKLCILLWGSGQFPSSSGVSRGRWSLSRQPTGVLTLGILETPPRARRAFHSIEFEFLKGPRVSVCSGLAQESR